MRRKTLVAIACAVALGGLWVWLTNPSVPGSPSFSRPSSATGPANPLVGQPDSARQADVEEAQVTAEPSASQAEAGQSTRVTIGRNESFYVAFQRAGFDHETIMDLVKACRPHVDLRRVRRGDEFDVTTDASGGLLALRAEVDPAHFLVASRHDDGFASELRSYPVERVVKGVRGRIDNNLFDALKEAGADPSLAVALSEILGWDIDFFRDLRRGDTFEVVYEEFVHDGRTVRDGSLLSARFVNDGHTYEAYRFDNEFGLPAYYDASGRSLEKQFLRAPLKFTHVSSGFSHHRFHPILKYYRPHEGIDYAAPAGTPVRATAAGVVTARRRYRGNGNFVALRHGAGYESMYLHLSRFAHGLSVGKHVQQGDIIGYVGSTGLSTAPHLCYRIKKNGRFINPNKLDLPPSEPVDPERRGDFERVRDEQKALLEAIPQEGGVVVLSVPPEPAASDTNRWASSASAEIGESGDAVRGPSLERAAR